MEENPEKGVSSLTSIISACAVPFWIHWVKDIPPWLGAAVIIGLFLLFRYYGPKTSYKPHIPAYPPIQKGIRSLKNSLSSLGTDSTKDILENPDKYLNKTVIIRGTADQKTLGGDISPSRFNVWYLRPDSGPKMEFRGCTPDDLDTIKINATVRKFHSCNCEVKQTVGSRKEGGPISRTDPRRTVEQCLDQKEGSPTYHDSRCKKGTKKEHYYLQCNNRLR